MNNNKRGKQLPGPVVERPVTNDSNIRVGVSSTETRKFVKTAKHVSAVIVGLYDLFLFSGVIQEAIDNHNLHAYESSLPYFLIPNIAIGLVYLADWAIPTAKQKAIVEKRKQMEERVNKRHSQKSYRFVNKTSDKSDLSYKPATENKAAQPFTIPSFKPDKEIFDVPEISSKKKRRNNPDAIKKIEKSEEKIVQVNESKFHIKISNMEELNEWAQESFRSDNRCQDDYATLIKKIESGTLTDKEFKHLVDVEDGARLKHGKVRIVLEKQSDGTYTGKRPFRKKQTNNGQISRAYKL